VAEADIVLDLSPKADVDEKRGLVFPARIRLTKRQFKVDGVEETLPSGMSVSAEIVTGKRRVISYLWSPVAKAINEAGRER
jgi:hemolysin D